MKVASTCLCLDCVVGEACGCKAAMKFRVAMFKLCVKGVDE